jgi:uncharacterized protein (DUF2235 family)
MLLPGELDDLREGYQWRRECEQNDLAVLCATIMNSSGHFKRWIRPADLFQIPNPQEPKTSTRSAADKHAELESLKKSFENISMVKQED